MAAVLGVRPGRLLTACVFAVLLGSVPGIASGNSLSVDMHDDHYSVMLDQKPLLQGSGVAIFSQQTWYASDGSGANVSALSMLSQRSVEGRDCVGAYTGVQSEWKVLGDGLVLLTTAKSYPELGNVVTFSYNITGAALLNCNSSNATNTITNYPALSITENPNSSTFLSNSTSFLTWVNIFARPIRTRRYSYGASSGPHVFINSEAPVDEADVMIMSYLDHFMSSSQSDVRYDGQHADWVPGISQSVTSLPVNFSQTFILFYGKRGLTQAIHDWGQLMQSTHSPTGKLVRYYDPSLEYLGYQTDNGAMYCFCSEDCVQKLLDVADYLRGINVPIQYLSHQGEWWLSSMSSPWCVTEWAPNKAYTGMSVSDFQKKFGVPLQLYAPYFCNDTKYAKSNGGQTEMVDSDHTLPRCGNSKYKLPSPSSASQFYSQFFQLGKKMGMNSFEIDFMFENYVCLPAFRESPVAVETWMEGLHQAAMEQNMPMQWCMASPTNMLASLSYPTVTNFRASIDYKGGVSYHIGLSSILIWAVGAAPSKDTFWTTDNMPLATEIGGCDPHGCPRDHTNASQELHTILAILSTGPVAFSDARNMTNASLIMRTCQKNGTLLKPAKPVTSIDATFSALRAPSGSIFQTYCGNRSKTLAFLLVSFSMTRDWNLTMEDLWSPSGLPSASGGALPVVTLVYRIRWNYPVCVDQHPASGCVELVTLQEDATSSRVLSIPARPDAENDLTPCLTSVWPIFCRNGWVLLGELSKYVPLAASRFPSAYECTESGVEFAVRGSAGEVVTVTALGPGLNVLERTAFVRDVTIGNSGLVSIHIP